MMHGLSLIIEMLNKYLHMVDLSSASQVPAIVINEASVKAEGSAAAAVCERRRTVTAVLADVDGVAVARNVRNSKQLFRQH